MAKITFGQISKYLETLRTIYSTIDEGKLKKELNELNQVIDLLNSLDKGTVLPLEIQNKHTTQYEVSEKAKNTNKGLSSKNSVLHKTYTLFCEQKFDQLKGTKLNYEAITTEHDVIQFLNEYLDAQVLKHTTALDLKLLYCIISGEFKEISGKKQDLLHTIKQHIRAAKRGEAFTQAT
ncbi:hypothetical protein [Bacillus pinisoli]|uniref:hypothetical protein n=1 Tax=Bacillus pinisoli TaxID=2901866 RepID=UPI001FF42CFA|nr:hypothetical protein [Bacillus pinisoli]